VRPEFRAYAGQQVKQADVVLLTYPWEYPRAAEVDRSNLDYYTPRYDPDGPAMTDSVNSVLAAQLGIGCSAWTYTLRSLDPFVKAPYEQFTEARSGQGVFTFLTGEGGFLQEFLYGYTGLRWRAVRRRPRPVGVHADAAVDGSAVTVWTPDTDPATPSTLTVRVAGTPALGQATLSWLDARPLAPYTLQVRTAGAWRTVATVAATTDMVDEVSFEPVAGDAVRLRIPATRFGGHSRLAELAVRG
jgi:hypothetical protein